MVAMLAIAQGRAFFRNRFVRTQAFNQEQVRSSGGCWSREKQSIQ